MIIKPTTPKIYVPQDRSCVLDLDARDVRGSKIYDRSGKGNHGAITGASLKRKNYGLPVLKFDGVDDYVRIPDSESLSPTSAMTAMVWVKGAAQNDKGCLGKWDGTASQMQFLILANSISPYDKLRVVISDDGTFDDGHRKKYDSSIVAFDSTWHLIGFSFDAGTLKLFVDGVEDTNPTKTTDDAITTIYNSTADAMVGCYLNSDTPQNFFNGDISGAKIWNRALGAEELSKIFNNLKHLYGK